MSWFSRAANAFRTTRLLRQLDDELVFHVLERADQLVAEGMSPDEARAEALRRFGNYTRQRERTRDMNIVPWLEGLIADLTYGGRQLRLNPGFTAVAVLSLALGIGANTAIFQLINALRLRSLPAVQAPWELAAITDAPNFSRVGTTTGRHAVFTYPELGELRRSQQAFSDILAFAVTRFNLTRGGEARYAEGLYVSGNFLSLLGVAPAFGGGFTGDVDGSDCSGGGALISHAFWQQEFGGDPGAIGVDLYLDGRLFPVVGVTPSHFIGLEPGRRFDVALPLCAETVFASDGRGRLDRRDAWWLTLVGRLQPGWTIERAAAHLRDISPTVFAATIPTDYRPEDADEYLANRLTAEDGRAGLSSLRRQYEDPLWTLLAVTGLVLLIACANLANLLLARASVRQREMAVRQAVGASRGRLLGQLLAESLLLAGIGAVCGLIVAQVVSRGLVAFLTHPDQPLVVSLAFDSHVFWFTTGLALVTCVLFGVAPALKATGTPPALAMQGGRGTSQSAERHGLRRALVVAQVALSVVLLFGAMLFGQTLRNLLTVDAGIAAQGILVAGVDARLPELSPEHRRVVFDDMYERIAAQPGVVAVAQVALSPFSGSGWNHSVLALGADAKDAADMSWFNRVGPGYFDTLATPLLAGRDFTRQDDASAPDVAIVNQEFARRFFGGASPVGRVFRVQAGPGEASREYQIVGLVQNTKYNGLREEFRPIAFLPMAQEAESPVRMTFLVRSQAPPGTTMSGIRALMTEMQQGLLVQFRVLDAQIARSVLRERLMAMVSAAFGVLAAVLSALGLYGVMSYMVTRRRNELGVRIALGAGGRHVLGLVFSEAARLVAVGLAVGVVGAYAVARYAESMLFGLRATDPTSLALACALLACTGALSALVPAFRASRLDPAVVLRTE